MVWDVRQKDQPVAKFTPLESQTGRDCWCVAFGNSYNNEERVIAAGFDNGDVKLFDLKTMNVRWSKCLKNGVHFRNKVPTNTFFSMSIAGCRSSV